MNNILVRSLSGAVFVALILVPLWFSKEISTIIFGIFSILGLVEFYRFFDKSDSVQLNWKTGAIIGAIIFILSVAIIHGYLSAQIFITFIPILFILFILEIWRNKKQPILNVSVSGFGIIYVILPFVLMVLMNNFDSHQFPTLAGMFLIIWMNDTFAFLSGKFFGKTKLIERISPNKTWEGTIGGFVFAVLAGLLIASIFDQERTIFWLIASFIIAPCSILGDLLESLFKRNTGVKDSGSIMPGHGGILDRFDATLLTVPFFYGWIYVYNLL